MTASPTPAEISSLSQLWRFHIGILAKGWTAKGVCAHILLGTRPIRQSNMPSED
jgi:hypothetical protein